MAGPQRPAKPFEQHHLNCKPPCRHRRCEHGHQHAAPSLPKRARSCNRTPQLPSLLLAIAARFCQATRSCDLRPNPAQAAALNAPTPRAAAAIAAPTSTPCTTPP